MVAHLDAVTSLAVDPNGIYLMSGSKGFVFVFF